MTEWWTMHDGAVYGAIGGSVIGVAAGVYGGLVGWLAPKGIGRRVMVPLHLCAVAAGFVALVTGVVALIQKQPYHVFYPLLLVGGIMAVVMGSLLPVVVMRYRQAEARKIDAQLLRKG